MNPDHTKTEGFVSEHTRMPAGFVGHGSPMNTLEHNRFTDAWRTFGGCVPVPRAVLCISAHWYTNATAVTAMAHRSEEHTSELQSLMRISYAVFCFKKQN